MMLLKRPEIQGFLIVHPRTENFLANSMTIGQVEWWGQTGGAMIRYKLL